MRRTSGWGIGLVAMVGWACGGGPDAAGGAPAVVQAAAEPAPEPAHLPRPFTAEQIREAMPVGFTAVLETTTPDGVTRQRWTVVSATEESVEIEYATLGDDGAPVGETATESATWVELRDHATFGRDVATREAGELETPLGRLSGWTYRVPGEEPGTVSWFFFADDFPGAPVVYWVEVEGQRAMTMAQVERTVPGA